MKARVCRGSLTLWLISANRECQPTKHLHSPDAGREASFARDALTDWQPAQELGNQGEAWYRTRPKGQKQGGWGDPAVGDRKLASLLGPPNLD